MRGSYEHLALVSQVGSAVQSWPLPPGLDAAQGPKETLMQSVHYQKFRVRSLKKMQLLAAVTHHTFAATAHGMSGLRWGVLCVLCWLSGSQKLLF